MTFKSKDAIRFDVKRYDDDDDDFYVVSVISVSRIPLLCQLSVVSSCEKEASCVLAYVMYVY